MTTLVLVVILVGIFVVGLMWPRLAGKIERKTDKEAGMLKRMSNWFWDPITWWAKTSIDANRKAIKKVAGWGKKIRQKINKGEKRN